MKSGWLVQDNKEYDYVLFVCRSGTVFFLENGCLVPLLVGINLSFVLDIISLTASLVA